jgi:hypothetical protein
MIEQEKRDYSPFRAPLPTHVPGATKKTAGRDYQCILPSNGYFNERK